MLAYECLYKHLSMHILFLYLNLCEVFREDRQQKRYKWNMFLYTEYVIL